MFHQFMNFHQRNHSAPPACGSRLGIVPFFLHWLFGYSTVNVLQKSSYHFDKVMKSTFVHAEKVLEILRDKITAHGRAKYFEDSFL